MRNPFLVGLAFTLVGATASSGCGQRAETPRQAIEISQSKPTVHSQINYLVNQAYHFLDSQDIDQAMDVAQYILAELDRDSAAAKKILEQAEAEMVRAAQKAAKDMISPAGLLGR